MAAITPLDLFNSLSADEQRQILKSLDQEQTPCQRNGHDFRAVAKVEYWFASPQVKVVCKRCGKVRIV